MKRKWIWLLAALPLVAGLVLAKRLADKRPRLVARRFNVLGLTISPDGKRIIARGDQRAKSQIINLDDGSRISMPGGIDSRFFFSPDATKIYQLNVEWERPNGKQLADVYVPTERFHMELVVRDAYSGRSEGQFRFAYDADPYLYGVTWQGDELIAESPRQTWHLDPNTLRVRSIQKQNRTQTYGELCPDGQSLYRLMLDKKDPSALTQEIADLNTGKTLRSRTIGASSGETIVKFSADGRTALGVRYDQKEYEVVARNTRTGAEEWRLRGPQSGMIALAPDQSAIYEARPNGELWKWPR